MRNMRGHELILVLLLALAITLSALASADELPVGTFPSVNGDITFQLSGGASATWTNDTCQVPAWSAALDWDGAAGQYAHAVLDTEAAGLTTAGALTNWSYWGKTLDGSYFPRITFYLHNIQGTDATVTNLPSNAPDNEWAQVTSGQQMVYTLFSGAGAPKWYINKTWAQVSSEFPDAEIYKVRIGRGTLGTNAHIVQYVDDAVLNEHTFVFEPELTPTSLTVADVSGRVGQTVQLSAKLTAAGKGLAGQTVSFQVDSVSAGSATTDNSGNAYLPYPITTAGNKPIEASFAGASHYEPSSGSATLTVPVGRAGAAALTGISLTLDPVTVAAGGTTTATVTGDNGVDYTADSRLSIQFGARGSWAGPVYTSEKAGTWTVTAVYNTFVATAPLEVNPAAAATISLEPATATITAGQSQTYVASAADAYGNSVPVALSENGAGSFAGNTYNSHADDAGNDVTITATADAQVATATLTVLSASAAGLILAWDKDTREFYLCADPSNPEDGELIVGSGAYVVGGVAVPVTVAGTARDRRVMIGNSTLRVRYFLAGGNLRRVYQYSTIAGRTRMGMWMPDQTRVDGTTKAGFWGLTHTVASDLSKVTYGSTLQP